MKKNKPLFITLTVIIVLTLIILIINKSKNKNSDRVFNIENVDKIGKVFLADKMGNNVLLVRDGSHWILNDRYYAADNMVRNMLNISSRLKVREPVSKSAHNNVISQLSSTGKKVEFYADGYKIDFLGIKLFPTEKNILTFYVGSHTKDNLGTFMIKEGSNRPYVVYIPGYRGFVSPYFSTSANTWRSHTVFNQVISQIDTYKYVDNEYPEQSYTIKNIDSRRFELKKYPEGDIITYDTVKMIDLLSSFSEIKYENIISDPNDTLITRQIDSVLNTVPAHELSLIDKYGYETIVKTYRIPNYGEEEFVGDDWYDKDRLYAYIRVPSPLMNDKSNTGDVLYDEDFVLIQYFTFDNVLRKLDYLAYKK